MTSYKSMVFLPITEEERDIILTFYPRDSQQTAHVPYKAGDFALTVDSRLPTNYTKIELVAISVNRNLVPVRRCTITSNRDQLMAIGSDHYGEMFLAQNKKYKMSIITKSDNCIYLLSEFYYNDVSSRTYGERHMKFLLCRATRPIEKFQLLNYDPIDFNSKPRNLTFQCNMNGRAIAYRLKHKGSRSVLQFDSEEIIIYNDQREEVYGNTEMAPSMFRNPKFYNIPFEVVKTGSRLYLTDIRNLTLCGVKIRVLPVAVRDIFDSLMPDESVILREPNGTEESFGVFGPKYVDSQDYPEKMTELRLENRTASVLAVGWDYEMVV